MLKNFIYLIILYSVLQNVLCEEEKSAIIDISPEQIRNIGESVVLNCTVDNPNNYSVIWTKKNRDRPTEMVLLSLDNKMAVRSSGFNITISEDGKSYLLEKNDIQPLDTAIYECQISISTSGKKITSDVELLVRTPAKISDTQSIIPSPVPEHQQAKLVCIAEGYPRPSVYWTRQYDAILPGGGNNFSGNELIIPSVTRQDRGTYYCIAENGVGEPDKKMFDLDVEFAPIISVPRPKVAQALEYDIELECRVEAYPAPAVTWYRNDKQIITENVYSIENIGKVDEVTNSVLRIKSLESYQYGDYYCKASNKCGHSEARLHLFESVIYVYPWNAISKGNNL